MRGDPQSFLDGKITLHAGDCLDVMATLQDNSIDACVCDPPYHLTSIVQRFGKEGAAPARQDDGAYARQSRGFMGKVWDGGDVAFRVETWRAVWRVLKPGAHLLAFGSTRGYGRMQVAIEDAGFETRDCILDLIDGDARVSAFVESLSDAQRRAFLRIAVESSDVGGLLAWMFGTGFPKSHNVALDFEKRLCEPVEVNGRTVWRYRSDGQVMARTAPFRDARANAFAGHGTALKPAFEPIVMARKPLARAPGLPGSRQSEKVSVSENCEAWGTGAINIDASRVGWAGMEDAAAAAAAAAAASFAGSRARGTATQSVSIGRESRDGVNRYAADKLSGRWPANVIHDGSEAVTAAFPDTGVSSGGRIGNAGGGAVGHIPVGGVKGDPGFGDSGSSARFFFSAKADADDRLGSKHPTVKPVDVMRWLVRLVTRPGDTVIDMFAGTGTTGEAAWREGRRAVLIEREEEYRADIARRMALCLAGPDERKRESIKATTKDHSADPGPLFAATGAASSPRDQSTPPPRDGAGASTACSRTKYRPDRTETVTSTSQVAS